MNFVVILAILLPARNLKHLRLEFEAINMFQLERVSANSKHLRDLVLIVLLIIF